MSYSPSQSQQLPTGSCSQSAQVPLADGAQLEQKTKFPEPITSLAHARGSTKYYHLSKCPKPRSHSNKIFEKKMVCEIFLKIISHTIIYMAMNYPRTSKQAFWLTTKQLIPPKLLIHQRTTFASHTQCPMFSLISLTV